MGRKGLIAYGPDGMAEPLRARLSPAYPRSEGLSLVPVGGPINDPGEILAEVMIGRSPRLVRLAPVEPCTTGCIRVASIQMVGNMIGGDRCTPDAANRVTATVTVADEADAALSGATVRARFLDDYYLDQPVTGTTGGTGNVKLLHNGQACVGAIALLVEDVTRTGRVLDFTTGELTDYVIPLP